MNYRSVTDMNASIVAGLGRVPRSVDLVVGIPRSGILAASLLALHLNLPMTDLEGFLAGRVMAHGSTRKLRKPDGTTGQAPAGAVAFSHAIIIDDSVASGGSLKAAKEQVARANLPMKITWATVVAEPESKSLVDVYFDVCPMPRLFEWNLFHHPLLAAACFDIDGVLCSDPLESENDDGPKYCAFLAAADPLFIPTVEVGTLVTCRLEKYRQHTEAWLAKHNVRYRKLVMMDLPTKEARLAAGSHGQYKGRVYRDSSAQFFIESDPRQARDIAETSGKPVFCTGTWTLVEPGRRAVAKVTLREFPRRLYRKARASAAALLGPRPRTQS